MAKKVTVPDPNDPIHNIFRTVWEVPQTVAKGMFIGLAAINDTFREPLYKNRRSQQLPSLMKSGASIETMAKWWGNNYNKRNKGPR